MVRGSSQRSPLAKVGWIIPLAFVIALFVWHRPAPRAEAPPATAIPPPARPPSPLRHVGLPDNPDLAGLPEIFAVNADAAEWKDNRTIFSYWHPGAKAYAYFFEATRGNFGYRFRAIPEPPTDGAGARWDDSLGENSLIRFYRTSPAAAPATLPVEPIIKPAEPGVPEPVKIDDDPAPLHPVPGPGPLKDSVPGHP